MKHRVGFLYNHDAPHQIPHTAPIIAELAKSADVTVLTSSEAQENVVRGLLAPAVQRGIHFVRLKMSPAMRLLRPIGDWAAPFSRIAILRHNANFLASFNALVVPETTTTFLKSRFGLKDLRLIYLPHGAGDRAAGFEAPTKLFDLVLLSGPKVRDRMLAEGLITAENHRIVGYPKFDAIDLTARKTFFGDAKPVVLYNPHFHPYLSSWYGMGLDVIRYFAGQDRFNLIVAPHVMLYRRRIHISREHRLIRWRRDVPRDLPRSPNIHFDFGSPNSIDMSYTLSADIYLGDVSSQIYEWIVKPRPAIFLNSHGAAPAHDPNYSHWSLGQVIDKVRDLPAALAQALPFSAGMRQRQQAAFDYNFSRTGEPAAHRAARAIVEFLDVK